VRARGEPRANLLKQQIAWHLEYQVGDEEQARPEAERRVRESEVGLHLQLREADVDAIEERQDVGE